MKEVECENCADIVVIATQPDEQVVNGETPVEHANRTGHSHVDEPLMTGCPTCGNIWFYKGDADRATCPNCQGKATPGEVPGL